MPEPGRTGEKLLIEAEGAPLAARFYPPEGTARAHLVLHAATGVPQSYYAPFAAWAAGQGVGVLTYDYRDFGDSRRGPLRDSKASLADWAVLDQGAAETRLATLAPDGPLWVLGHSLGGFGFPFRRQDRRVAQITTVGAGTTHVSEHPWRFMPMALAFWYVLGPAGTAIVGYLPGRKLMLGADLPAGVYWQWRKWCTSRDFFRSEFGNILPMPDFQHQGAALRLLAMADDVFVPPPAVQRYAALFPQAAYRILRPAEFGLASLRHIEIFSARNAAAWPTLLGVPA
jgi:predicted alpha/beta hydrolase